MKKIYLLLSLIILIIGSGCIYNPTGWDQTKYEEYSAYYDLLRPSPGKVINASDYDRISKGMTIDEWLISIPKDKNEFENTWYLVFYYIKKAQDEPLSTSPCARNPYGEGEIAYEIRCQNLHSKSRMDRANVSYSKAAEYRQKIEQMKSGFII